MMIGSSTKWLMLAEPELDSLARLNINSTHLRRMFMNDPGIEIDVDLQISTTDRR